MARLESARWHQCSSTMPTACHSMMLTSSQCHSTMPVLSHCHGTMPASFQCHLRMPTTTLPSHGGTPTLPLYQGAMSIMPGLVDPPHWGAHWQQAATSSVADPGHFIHQKKAPLRPRICFMFQPQNHCRTQQRCYLRQIPLWRQRQQ